MNDQIFLKMFFFLVFLLLNCSIINCTSLVRSRATGHSNTNRIIYASLTDKDTGRVWQMQEWVYSGSPRAGRIEIESDENEVNVFYSYKNSRDNNIRLVIHDNECDLYNYGLKWENLLPGVNKPLTNLILLLGPSLLDRFSAFDWANGNDEIIRGSLMHSVSTDLDGKLNITLYYENNLNQINGIQQPSRIVFTGHNPETLVEGEVETLILDIYLQSQTEQRLDKLVQVTPGFGCPVYLHGDKAFPELNSVKIHFIAAEQINNRYIGVNEFHADETYQVVRQSLLEKGYLQEMIYDYHLATRYHISIHGCYASPISSDAPGMEESGSFSIARLLWLSKTLKYLGQIIFEHRSGYNVHVWESIETNRVINGKTYDKVVTTQYLSSSYQNDIFNRYSLVAASIKGYHKNDKGSYVLSYSSHRDYYDSNSDLPESEYHAALQVEDCFKKPEERLNLKFHLTCKDSERCIEKSQDSVYEMRELFRSSLLGQPGISSTRVSDIQFKFQKEVIEVDVTFLQAPQISEVLPSEPETLQPQSISKLHETVASSAEECLQYHSSFVPSGPVIIHCVHGNVCFSTKSAKDIKRGSGIGCYIYTDPFKKLNRLGQEKRLSDLHDHILGYFGHITFNMDLDEKAKAVAFQVTDVIAQNEGDEVRKQPFETLYHKKQFDEIDGVHTVMVPGVNRFGDCYRACSQNEDIPCETFSFCNRKDKKECAVSIWSESQIKNNLTGDSDCTIYSKIHFFDYNVRRNLKYKHPTTVFKESSIRDCASECHASEDCVSFQHCRGLKCSFGGYATSANTEFYEGCDIYILKSSEKYKITGTKLVRQVLYTEVDLDLEQCAAICDDDQSCKSFNFCPKGKAPSQCQITSYSMKDPKTESVDSSICHNFELPVKSKAEAISDNSPDIKVSGVSGGGVFGIIMLCLFIGLFAGFICPYAYTKVKSRDINKSKVDFGWSKHEDDDESQTQI